jgi:ergothioneine biosynthesis protein EgtB
MVMPAGVQTVRKSLIERLEAARAISDATLSIMRPQALYDRPIAERHRIIFYVGHLEAFDWNLMTSTIFDGASLNPNLEKLFAFGIDPMDGGLPADVPADWPSPQQIRRYCDRVRAAIDAELCRITCRHDQILNVAIEHRLMHAETLSYIFHWLPAEHKIPAGTSLDVTALSETPRMLEIPAGVATLGLPSQTAFGWDNEFLEHEVRVPAFAIDKYKVTNARFLDFVNAGSYSDRSLWSDADWRWKDREDIRHPKFWVAGANGWRFRTMFDEIPMPADWPVYVSHAEASAYARWAGMSLPTETQWHRAAYGTPNGSERQFPWGAEAPSSGHGNFDFSHWDPVPVHAHPEGDSAFGVADLVGNGWEWTSTPFAPFDGFEAFSFYPGYSAAFFDGRHYVMKGGSFRTARCMLRRSFRNWFQPHYPHIYAGFRCVAAS